MENLDFKAELLKKIEEHCTKEQKNKLLRIFQDMEETTLDTSNISQLYKELHSLYEMSAFDYQSFLLNVRKRMDIHSYYIACSDMQSRSDKMIATLIRDTYNKIHKLILASVSKDKVSRKKALFECDVDISLLALDLVESVYGVLLRMNNAKETAKFYYELNQFSKILNSGKKAVEMRLYFKDVEMDQKFTSSKFLDFLNDDFVSFFSLRLPDDLETQYMLNKAIASNLDTVLLYKVVCVLFKHNLLPTDKLTYDLGDNIRFSLARRQACFISDLLEIFHNGPLYNRDGNIIEDDDEKNSYVRKRLMKGKPDYDKTLDVVFPKFFSVGDDNV